MRSTIILIRHAHTGMAGRFCGQSDPPLSECGYQQLHNLGKELSKYPLTHVFSSDLLRSRETADFVASKSGLAVAMLPSLRELHFGEWEGLNWNEVSERDAVYAKRWMEQYPWLPAPKGEDFAAFRERVRGALAEVDGQIAEGCAAVVTHAGVIRTFMLDVLNLPESALAGLECGYASCIAVCRSSGHWYLSN